MCAVAISIFIVFNQKNINILIYSIVLVGYVAAMEKYSSDCLFKNREYCVWTISGNK